MKDQKTPKEQKKDGFTVTLGIGGGPNAPGTPVPEFLQLVKIVTKRHGKGVMIRQCDKDGRMHLTKDKQHLGYIDINTGSLVWDPVKP